MIFPTHLLISLKNITMKILIFTPYIGNNYGGIAKAVEGIATAIANEGVIVDVITTDANNLEKIPVPVNQWLDRDSYRICYFSCWHKGDLVVSPSLINWLILHIHEYDVIHTNTVFSPMVSLVHWLCRLRKIPYIITPHGMLEPWALSYKGWKKKLYLNLVEQPLIKKSSAIQVIANAEAGNVKTLGFKQSVTIPNGIHQKDFTTLPDAEIFYQQFPATRHKKLILFLGRIDPKKGLDLLAPAFAQVHNNFPETHLIVAGPNSTGFLTTVQNYFAQANCLDAVTFTGMLTGEIKYAALAAASLYVAPSYSEGFSISVLEGMASGLPCVITTGCNFPEAEQANAAYVVDIQTREIASSLNHCLSHPQDAEAIGLRARDFILKNYTWETSAKKLIGVYRGTMNRKKTLNKKY
jgi:glycosyltransferase involved in cell wall biosynthesis